MVADITAIFFSLLNETINAYRGNFIVSPNSDETVLMKVTPEDLGLSAPRLIKIDLLMQKYVDEGKLPGSLSLWFKGTVSSHTLK